MTRPNPDSAHSGRKAIRIDAHQHFWDRSHTEFDYRWQETPDLAPICRTYVPTDLAPHLAMARIDKSIVVQTQHNLGENDWSLQLADQYDWVAGVVGWIDLASPACEDQLLAVLNHPRFVGIRHITQDEPDDDFIVRDDIRRGLRVLEKHQVPFDLLFFVKHLRHAARLAAEFPDLPMVIDHLAKPEIKARRMDNWLPHLQAAAKFPNVFCKLSGMVTEASWQTWTVDDLRPYVERALESFGPDRCMYGSDWPVCELAATYEQVHEALTKLVESLSDDEQSAIFGRTATEFYGLPV
ncbi:MAG: amidohydrolase family protein [Planctomycetales bacterium]|nr:amidohydrolase family protein [Planctomycetales bacterium]